MLLTALAIDIMLPTFAAVRRHFGLGPQSTATAQLVTFFFLGQFGQLFCGPLADRYGRLPILRTGFLLYIGGCVATVLVPSLSWLLIARFVTGLGASALFVGAIASVRDRFEGNQMARIMSLVLTIFLTVPIIAPLLGVAILEVASWQAVFLTPPFFAVVFFVWSLRLSESVPAVDQSPSGIKSLIQSLRLVYSNRVFVRYSAITTILFGAFSSYIGSSERMVGTLYGRPSLFVFIFASIGLTMTIFTFLNARLVARIGAKRTVRMLLSLYLVVASLLLGLTLFLKEPPGLFIFFAFVALLQGINVAVEPNSSALALEPMGARAGMAASIYGTSYLVAGSLMGSLIDRLLVDSVVPLTVAYFVGGLVAVVLVRSDH
jgi:DHA1 family bicyclomycin/chloramphenicol resistance-like MFS transporter